MLMRVRLARESHDKFVESPTGNTQKQALQDLNDCFQCEKTISNLLVIWAKESLFNDDDDLASHV